VAGGGALIRGFDKLLEEHTMMKVRIARDPLSCVVIGTGYVVEQMHDDPFVRRMLEKASLH
jgi:rod shape-determining protein MreB